MIGKYRRPPVEALSARVLRYRIARGYSPDDLAEEAGIFPGTIRRIESGKPIDKRVLAPIAKALAVPLCQLVCGEHNCAQRACRLGFGGANESEPLRCWLSTMGTSILRLQDVFALSQRVHSTGPLSGRLCMIWCAIAFGS
jgi:transcriptional regulator with XRE-family HTH domain